MEQQISRRGFLKATGFTTMAAALAMGAPAASAKENRSPEELGCADIPGCDYAQIIIYGQSLAAGTETMRAITTDPLDGVYMVGSDAHWYKAPVLTGLNPCRNNGYESPIVAAVNHFATLYRRYRDPNQKFIANSTGLGGRSIERLSKGCTSYGYEYLYKDAFLDYLDNTKAAVSARWKKVRCVAVIFMQGEYNYDGYNGGQGFTKGTDGTTDKEEYKAYLHQLKKDMQADIMAKYGQKEPPLFLVYQTGGSFITNSTSSINMAQQEMVAECEDAILLGSAMPCPRFNGGHMSSNGYRWQGEMIGRQLAKTFLGEGGPQTTLDRDVRVEGNRVILDYEVPVPPLVADPYTVQEQANYGYSVYENGTGVSIENVEVQAASVILTCSKELHGVVTVKYAGNTPGGKNHRGIGNIRDSDSTVGIYPYVEDADEISSMGNTIDYRPKTADGGSLVGRPYPLYNWACHTYREVVVDRIDATDFTLKVSATKAGLGEVLDLSVAYIPEDATTCKKITWQVSDASKARLEDGKVTILSGANDTVSITGTLENGQQHHVDITIVADPYAAYYSYWDFTGGNSANTTVVRNLVTNQDDDILVHVDGSRSGYLTAEGLTLAADSAVKVPIVRGMPDGMEIGMEFLLPVEKCNYNEMRLKAFLTLIRGSTDELECGSETYGYAWPMLRGVNTAGSTKGVAWWYGTDAEGNALGNTGIWWSDKAPHQHLRLRLNVSGEGEFAMRKDGEENWRVWKLPAYQGADNKYPGFQRIKDACDTILFGNRAALNGAVEGTVLYRAYIREYTG